MGYFHSRTAAFAKKNSGPWLSAFQNASVCFTTFGSGDFFGFGDGFFGRPKKLDETNLVVW